MAGNSNFIRGIGRLATDRIDFQHHIDGYAFKHKAAIIDLNPSLTINGGTVTDVQSALAATSAELAVLELSGKGFITVGDGFDTYHFSDPEDPGYDPSAPYDSSIANFDVYLDNLLNISDPLDPDYNPLHSRIRDGGVILIKAGTYKFTGSVNVPPGFTLMGEGYGTRISNQCITPVPLFIIIPDPIDSRVPDAAVDSNTFTFNRETVFTNLVIADNFFVPEFLGDTSYLSPINDDNIIPLISMKAGTSFTCNNVKLSGRVTFTSGTIVNTATSFAIKLDASSPVTTGTYLKVNDCTIDGFSQPISFDSVGGTHDYLEVTNCKIRSHGYLNADGSTQENNCIIHMNDNNAVINNNDFYGNHSALTTLVFIKNVIASPPTSGALSQIVISSNEMAVEKGSLSFGADPIIVDVGIAGSFNLYAYILAAGNLCANGFSVTTTADASSQIYVDANNIVVGNATNVTLEGTHITLDAAAEVNISATTDVNIIGNTGTTTIGDSGTTAVNIQATNTTIDNTNTNLSSTNFAVSTPTNGGNITLGGSLFLRTKTITATPYTIDAVSTDYMLFVDLTTIAAATTITLPVPTAGRVLTIKDRDGYAGTYNIILSPRDGYADSYSVANANTNNPLYSASLIGVAQSFTGNGQTLYSSKAYLSKTGSPFSTVVAKIYAHTGSFGTSSKPTGTALATSATVNASSLSSSAALISFSFTGANQIVLANGTNYVYAIEYSGGSVIATVNVGIDTTTPTHDGNKSTLTGSTWTAVSGEDMIFYIRTSDKIDGVPNNATFSSAYGSWTLIANGTDWSLI